MMTFFLRHRLEGFAEDQITAVARDRTFVLAPQERPVVEVLEVVGPAEQHAGRDVAGDEREVRAVVAVEDFLRARRADRRHERVVVVRVAAEHE